MKFWDSSALVPLLADESKTEVAKALATDDPAIVVSFITPIEVESAIWRKARGTVDEDARQRAHRRLSVLRSEWVVVEDYAAVLERARVIVGRHGLRSADAIQLATAVIARGPGNLSLVTFDEQLAAAARAEGFPVLP